ncbi:MAG: DUF2237 domain-containing protein [Bacteroidota bacterium]
MNTQRNVFGSLLIPCGNEPLTGFFRDGCCSTGPLDLGTHTVCAIMTQDFLTYTKSKGNDLSTPRLDYNFSGLRPGDRWCLCLSRWQEAHHAGKAPRVVLEATNEKSLEYIPLEILKLYDYKLHS